MHDENNSVFQVFVFLNLCCSQYASEIVIKQYNLVIIKVEREEFGKNMNANIIMVKADRNFFQEIQILERNVYRQTPITFQRVMVGP